MPSAPNARACRIARNVGIGANAEVAAERVGPAHELHAAPDRRVGGRWCSSLPLITRPVVPSSEIQSPSLNSLCLCTPHLAVLFVDFDVARAGDAGLAHAAGDHGGVAGHAAARGQNALRDFHAVNIVGRGFRAHQDHGTLLPFGFFDRFVGGEHDLSDGRAGRGRQSGGEHFELLRALLVEARDAGS